MTPDPPHRPATSASDRRPGRRRDVRGPVAALAAAAAAALLTACQAMSPIQTDVPYEPADGVAVTLGDIAIRDLVVVSAAEGAPGVLSGYVVNSGTDPVTLSIGIPDGTPLTADVPPRTTRRLSGEGAPSTLQLSSVAAAPGSMIQLNVATPATGTDQVLVPVLPPTLYYSTLTPTATPAASATAL